MAKYNLIDRLQVWNRLNIVTWEEWYQLEPHLTRHELPGGLVIYDWSEVRALTRAVPPNDPDRDPLPSRREPLTPPVRLARPNRQPR